jgi:hypothetical protein
MKLYAKCALVATAGLVMASCTPDWATQNSAPFILEIASINDNTPIVSSVPGTSDEVIVSVNALRKNNNPNLGVSPVEHIYLERYEVRYFRTDGRNTEGVDVPYRITGPVGNTRFHTPSPGGDGEVQIDVIITVVRTQAKLEPPLRNLRSATETDTGTVGFSGAGVLTCIAEITIHGRTIQGDVMEAVGRTQVTFANTSGTSTN